MTDRRVYLLHLAKEHGPSYALNMVGLLKSSVQLERAAREVSPDVLERFAGLEELLELEVIDETPEPDRAPAKVLDLATMLERKQMIEEQLEALELAA